MGYMGRSPPRGPYSVYVAQTQPVKRYDPSGLVYDSQRRYYGSGFIKPRSCEATRSNTKNTNFIYLGYTIHHKQEPSSPPAAVLGGI